MTQPCVRLLDTHELLEENLCHGNVLVQCDSNDPRIYIVEKFIKTENTYGHKNLRSGTPFLVACYCDDYYWYEKPIIHDTVNEDALNKVKVVNLKIPQTEGFVNAFLAYKAVIAELREMGVATRLIVRPDDEHVKQICGYFDESWHSVEFLHLPSGVRYVTVNYCEDEKTNVRTSSDMGFLKLQYLASKEQYTDTSTYCADDFRRTHGERVEELIRERSWDCLEPCVSVILGVKSIDLADVNEILTNFGLIDYICMNEAKRTFFSEHGLSLEVHEFERTVKLFCVCGHVSNMKSFISEVKDLSEGCVIMEKWLPYDKHFVGNYYKPRLIKYQFEWNTTRLKRRRNLLISIITVFCQLDVPPYVILEILDWIKFCQSMQHREKIDLIYNVQNSIKKIVGQRENRKKIKL